MPLQGSLSIERMCRLAEVSRARKTSVRNHDELVSIRNHGYK